jgi:hypothetical protein
MFATICIANKNRKDEDERKIESSCRIDVVEKENVEQRLKTIKETYWMNSFLVMMQTG